VTATKIALQSLVTTERDGYENRIAKPRHDGA
jgi:hypothetical protein